MLSTEAKKKKENNKYNTALNLALAERLKLMLRGDLKCFTVFFSHVRICQIAKTNLSLKQILKYD